jgi:hypothetical protein
MISASVQLRIAIVSVSLALLTACTPSPDVAGTPATSPPMAPPVPGFPNLSEFTPVDTQTYVMSYPSFNGFVFTTPDGFRCGHNGMSSLSNPSHLEFACSGTRPDKGPGTWDIDVATDEPASIEPGRPQREPDPSYTPDPSMVPKPLPAMHRITFKDIECAVDDKGMTACRVGDHGFLLTATSTELF